MEHSPPGDDPTRTGSPPVPPDSVDHSCGRRATTSTTKLRWHSARIRPSKSNDVHSAMVRAESRRPVWRGQSLRADGTRPSSNARARAATTKSASRASRSVEPAQSPAAPALSRQAVAVVVAKPTDTSLRHTTTSDDLSQVSDRLRALPQSSSTLQGLVLPGRLQDVPASPGVKHRSILTEFDLCQPVRTAGHNHDEDHHQRHRPVR
jgi:hypothetical protein